MDWSLCVAAVFIQFGLSAVQTIRWMMIANRLGLVLPFARYWKNVLIGLFFNQTLPPSIGGDAVRIWHLRGVGIGLAFRTIIIDRLFALFTISLLCFLSLVFLKASGTYNIGELDILITITLLGISGLAFFTVAYRFLHKLRFSFMVEKMKIRLLCSDFRRILTSSKVGVHVFLYSVLIHLCVSLSGYLLLMGFGTTVSFGLFFLLFSIILLLSTIPISIGGWGFREIIMISLMGAIGLANETALALSIIFGVIIFIVGTPGGVLWLLTHKNIHTEKT